MCELTLVGANTDGYRLLRMLSGAHDELDVQLIADAQARRCFPETDSVARVTWNGCSCSLLEGLGGRERKASEAHVAGPGYAFRRGIAATVMAFGGARLLITRNSEPSPARRLRFANLAQFLRFGVSSNDALIAIVP